MFALFIAENRKPFSQEDLPVISVEVKTSSRITPDLCISNSFTNLLIALYPSACGVDLDYYASTSRSLPQLKLFAWFTSRDLNFTDLPPGHRLYIQYKCFHTP